MGVLAAGTALLIVADVVLAFSASIWPVLAGVAFWGLHMGLTQGLLATLVADTAPVGPSWNRFWGFQLHDWPCDVGGQCHCREPVGSLRAGCDLSGGGSLHDGCPGRIPDYHTRS